MIELGLHPVMDRRTVKAWETNNGGFVQVYDTRDIFHGNYSVEVAVCGGMESIYSSSNLEKCIDKAKKYASTH